MFKGITHGQRDESGTELAAYDDLVARFGANDTPEIQVQVATALVNKGVTHGRRSEHDAALVANNDLIARFGASDTPEIQVQVAKTLVNKGVTHGRRGEHDAALVAYDDLVARFGSDDTPELQHVVAMGLVKKGNQQISIGHAEEALRTSDALDRRFGGVTDNEPEGVAIWRWRAKWIKTQALFLQEKHAAALDVFRSICAMFVTGHETMLREMLQGVSPLLVAGASAGELGEILSAESRTAGVLAPLVVALQLIAGESVRGPAEMLEVAADVREKLEEVTRSQAGQGSRG